MLTVGGAETQAGDSAAAPLKPTALEMRLMCWDLQVHDGVPQPPVFRDRGCALLPLSLTLCSVIYLMTPFPPEADGRPASQRQACRHLSTDLLADSAARLCCLESQSPCCSSVTPCSADTSALRFDLPNLL